MANSPISQYLTKILNSIYGRDVRQAIHDAISTCYNDVTSPSLNTGAFYTAVQQAINDGTLAVLEIQDGTITREKLSPDITFSIHYSDVPMLNGYTYLVEGLKFEIGGIAASSGGNTTNNKRVRTIGNIPYSNSRGRIHVEFPANDVYKYAVLTHHPTTSANSDSGWITSASTTRSIAADHYARMQFERLDGATITSEDLTAIAEALEVYCGDTTQTWLTNLLAYATSASANNLLKEGFQSLPGIALASELAEHIVYRYPASKFVNGYYGTSGDWTAGTSNRYTTDRTHKIFLRAGTRISLEGGTPYGEAAGKYNISYHRWDENGTHISECKTDGYGGYWISKAFTLKYDGYYGFTIQKGSAKDSETMDPDDPVLGEFTIWGVRYMQEHPAPDTSTVQETFDNFYKSVNHRGYRGKGACENTLPAFIDSKAKGFVYVETDVRFTSDNVPVLLHNETINSLAYDSEGNAMSNQAAVAIANITYEEALTYTFGRGDYAVPITTFEDFIYWCKINNIHPYIELKTGNREQIGIVYTLVEKYGMVKYCTWISFNLTLLEYIHDLDPTARLGYLGTPSAAGIQSFLALKTGQNELFYDTTVGSITEENCKQCQDVGIHMEGWTTSDRATIIRCSKIGVSGITTDDAHAQYIIQNQ